MKKTTPYSKILFKTKRLIIRPYKLTDFKSCQLSHAARLKKVNTFDEPIYTTSFESYSEFKEKVTTYREHGKLKVHFIFGIFEKKTGAHVGQVDLFLINKQMSWGNLGYQIQNHSWGKGYATEASKAALKIAFKELGFHRIEAGAELKNIASHKVAKKAGMLREGIRLKFFPNNGGLDMVIFGANAIDYR
ncbi:hypothetical protein A9Q84_00795 [Halobacteriovorax marinus]|uniref:N-acetyltransferase domain-containing protein n=1 Tax=Halobacteriovorax marinus TaxID=97084 RepID=A0A1Y5FC47_9BACT|nr:hypothetical protein A9Q84_00795 [Halobacteriovorax marinus]